VILLIALIAAVMAIHELGHALVGSMLGQPWKPVVSRRGVALKIGPDGWVPTRRELVLIAAGGPAANALVAAASIGLGFGAFAFLNLFALLNLLPIRHFDGYLILRGHA
jgi:Zn-dependent protease